MRAAIPIAAGLAAIVISACSDDLGGSSTALSDGGEASVPSGLSSGWNTDFSRHSVALDEFASGGPGKDGIPALDRPRFVNIAAAGDFLSDREPVAVLEVGGQARAYPLQILVWHEIVNDRIAGMPVAVTYCPLCNSTVAFDRRVDGRALSFGTTGNLRNSDLVMYDRRTESWWQQLTAEAVVGELTGTKLDVLPSQILSWAAFKRLHPEGEVLSTDTGFSRDYGQNPYSGYDDPRSAPFALRGEPDRTLPPKERVVAIQTGESAAVVYPFSRLAHEAPINDRVAGAARVGERPIVVFFDPEVASPLDNEQIAQGREVGTATVFERILGGRTLTFQAGGKPGTFVDRQTDSTWEINGRAVAGSLAGEALKPIAANDQFWFALAAFFPAAEIRD